MTAVLPAIAESAAELGRRRAALPGPVALVPTMGALHEGHRALVRAGPLSVVALLASLLLLPLPVRPGAFVVILVGVVAPRVDRLLDLVLRQFALDGLDELVLRARAELAQQLLLCPVALVVEQLRDLVLLQP